MSFTYKEMKEIMEQDKKSKMYRHYICRNCPGSHGSNIYLMNQRKDIYGTDKQYCFKCGRIFSYQGSTIKKIKQ